MNGYIYKITNTVNGKTYIGQTVQKPEVRFKAHVNELNAGKKKNSKFQNAWKKYGKDSFVFEVLMTCDTSELDIQERLFIKKYDSFRHGYNATKAAEYYNCSKTIISRACKGELKTAASYRWCFI